MQNAILKDQNTTNNHHSQNKEKILRILLINPKFPPSYWGHEYIQPLSGYHYIFPPLGLATVAALSEPHHIEIIDQNVESIDYNYAKTFDIVGLTGYMVQSEQEFAIADRLREQGNFVVIGGPNAFLIEPEVMEHCDVMVQGESEIIWPEFLRDFQKGNWKSKYAEEEKISLENSPTPRFDLLKLDLYTAGIVQTTRGCPFTCEFCDIIVMYGRKVREKPVEKVIKEVDLLFRMGKRGIFFADDNFIGNKRYAKKMLRALIEYNKQHHNVLNFHTQVSINLAKDEELLQLLYEARFQKIFIGIESPRKESLAETKKGQNVRSNLLEDVEKIQSYNILIMAGMIVGFDNDDKEIFQEQMNFLQNAGIPTAMIGTLQAIPHTPLFKRLLSENRLLHQSSGDNFSFSNFMPTGMSMKDLAEGYMWLSDQLYSIEKFTKRVLKNIQSFQLKGIPTLKNSLTWKDIKIFLRVIRYVLFRWNYQRHVWKMSFAVLKKSKPHFVQIISLFLSFVHMNTYVKKNNKLAKKNLAAFLKQVEKMKTRPSFASLPSLNLSTSLPKVSLPQTKKIQVSHPQG